MAVTAAELLIKIRAIVDGSRNIEEVRTGLDRLDGSAQRASSGLGGLGDAALAAALGVLVRQLLDAVAAFESMNNALAALHGSQEQANADMEFIVSAASRMGVNVREAGNAFISLTASTKGTALEGQNTRAIFEAVAGSMALLGKSSAETSRALAAISQIASKGTVSMEELRGQLGEALPGAMQASARSMQLTTEELIALVSTGTLTAEEFLPKLAAALNDTFGTAVPDTLASSMARLQNSVQLAFKDLGDSGSTDAFKAAMEGAGFAVNLVATILLGFQEAVEATGKSLGAFAAAVTQALSGDITGAFNTFGNNFNKVLADSGEDIDRFSRRVEKAGTDIGERTPPAILPAKTALDQLVKAFKQLDDKASDSAKKAADALGNLGKNIDLTTLDGVLAASDAFDLLGEKSELLSIAVGNSISRLNQADLNAFRTALVGAFQSGQAEGTKFLALIDNVALRQAQLNTASIEQSNRIANELDKRAGLEEALGIVQARVSGNSVEAKRLEEEAVVNLLERQKLLLRQQEYGLLVLQQEESALRAAIPVRDESNKEQQKQLDTLAQKIEKTKTAIAQDQLEIAQTTEKIQQKQEESDAIKKVIEDVVSLTAAQQAEAESVGKTSFEVARLAATTQDLAKARELEAIAATREKQENNEFLGSIRSASAAIAQYIDGVGRAALAQAQQAGAVDVAAGSFDRLYKSILSGINAAQQAGNFSDLFRNIQEAALEAERQAQGQQQAYEQLFQQIDSGQLSMRELADAQKLVESSAVEVNHAHLGIVRGLGLIDQQRLDNLISQIQSAQQAMRDLTAATQDQIFAEEQRRRRLLGDDIAAKQAEFAKEELELQKELAATKDVELRRQLAKQLELLRANNELELDQLRDKERERKRIEREAEAERQKRETERQHQEAPDKLPADTAGRPAAPEPTRQPKAEGESKRDQARADAEEEDRLREELHQRELKRIAARQAAGKLNVTLGITSVDEVFPELERRILRSINERARLRA